MQAVKNHLKPERRDMGSKNPLVYHCKRCHRTIKTKKRKGRDYRLPYKCGNQQCATPLYQTFPEVAFKEDFDPFTSTTHMGRLVFVDSEGKFCEECYFEWSRDVRMSQDKAKQLLTAYYGVDKNIKINS